MRFRIEAKPAAPSGWRIEATNLTSAWPTDASQPPYVRTVAAVGEAPEILVPLPRDQDRLPATGTVDLDALYAELCNATSPKALSDRLEQLTTKDLKGGALQALGRYLFSTLLGTSLWDQIKIAAGKDWIDLVLAFPANAPALCRLPWEVMCNGDGFLAEQPRVSVVREVVGTAGNLPELARAPRVLFVVGTQIDNDVIRPGAEYLQVARVLRSRQLDLKTSLVFDASPQRVKAAVDEFDPDVVHFICHGAIDSAGHAYLTLVDDGDVTRRKTGRVFASDVVKMLRGKNGDRSLPRMLVLSACYTASSKVLKPNQVSAQAVAKVGQIATPFAAELVAATPEGVPIVVAMSGPITDQACRLFTRQFYESLASEQDIARATAIGRLAAIRGDDRDSRQSVDWALPAIFVAGGVTGATLAVKRSDADTERQGHWNNLAAQWPYDAPTLFCDRFGVLERFDLLMATREAQQALTGKTRVIDVLAVEVPAKDQELTAGEQNVPEKFGRSQLLQELASKAYTDGHLPILISERLSSKSPKTVDELLQRINSKIQKVLYQVGLPTHRLEVLDWVSAMPEGPVADPPAFVPADVRYDVMHPQAPIEFKVATKGKALRHDLTRLLNDVREKCRPSDERARCRLVVLIDDLHRIEGESAGHVLDHIIGGLGLVSASADVRVVFTWASKPADSQQTAVKTIEAWVAGLSDDAKITIQRFGQRAGDPPAVDAGGFPLEERLTYEFFLLASKGLVSRPAQIGQIPLSMFWQNCQQFTKGVPSLLDSGVARALKAVHNINLTDVLFQQADDDKRLDMARAQER